MFLITRSSIRLPLLPLVINLIVLTKAPVSTLRIARPRPASLPPPQIWLNEYTTEDKFTGVPAEEGFQTMVEFRNEFISKIGTDYILQEGFRVAIFACQAKYPIMWSVPQMTQLIDFNPHLISNIDVRLSEFSPDVGQPTNKNFRSFLILSGLTEKFLSVDFVCKGVEGGSKRKTFPQSSLHIYVSNSLTVLEREGETISITHDPDSRSKAGLILPCRPSHPDTPITLEKKVDDDWTPILTESTPSLSFDPKVGFTLKRFFWGKKFLGLYRCTVNGSDVGQDEDAVVLVNVTSGSGTSPASLPIFESKLWTAKRANVSVIKEDNVINFLKSTVKCCFGKSSSTDAKKQTVLKTCFDRLQCDILKSTILTNMKKNDKILSPYPKSSINASTNCETVKIYTNPSLVMCKGENLDYAAAFMMIFQPGVADLAQRKSRMLTTLIDPANADEVTVELKILISVGRPPASTVSAGHHQHVYHMVGDVFSGRDFSKQHLLYFEGDARVRTSQFLSEYSRNYYYEGEPLWIMCFGLTHFYSQGARLRVNWKNGSRSLLERDSNEGQRLLSFSKSARFGRHHDIYGFVSVFGEELNASLEMDSVDCFMPVWNSEKWDKQTYNINTLASNPPTFVGGEMEEVVYFYVNETGKEISWEVNEVKPNPIIYVSKDGKKLSRMLYNSSIVHNGSTVIAVQFKVVTYETHGSYNCTAENFKGGAFKTFKVIVIPAKSSIAIPVILSCVVIALLAVLIFILIKCRVRLQQMWRLKRSHLY